jgi:hypothetical protein
MAGLLNQDKKPEPLIAGMHRAGRYSGIYDDSKQI